MAGADAGIVSQRAMERGGHKLSTLGACPNF